MLDAERNPGAGGELFSECARRWPWSEIRRTAAAIAELDVTTALAQVAAENRPTRRDFPAAMKCAAGRHPSSAPHGTGRGPLHLICI